MDIVGKCVVGGAPRIDACAYLILDSQTGQYQYPLDELFRHAIYRERHTIPKCDGCNGHGVKTHKGGLVLDETCEFFNKRILKKEYIATHRSQEKGIPTVWAVAFFLLSS